MSYLIVKADGSSFTIPEGSVDNTKLSIPLLGRLTINYGQTVAQALTNMLENFNGTNIPVRPTPGQIWHRQDSGGNQLRVYDPITPGSNTLADWKIILTSASGGSSFDEIIVNDATFNGTITLGSGARFHGDILPDAYTTGHKHNIGSSVLKWQNMYAELFDGVATAAQYADLAERYHADAIYTPGTLIKIGGKCEITQTTSENDIDVFGVISTAPGLMLNSSAGNDETHPYVALSGRVPVKVTGKILKGQRLVSSEIPGVARAFKAGDDIFSIFGRALENKETEEVEQILIVVGVKA